MVASGTAHRSSGSGKDVRAARTDLGLTTVALNCVCVFCWLKLVHVSECSARAAVMFRRTTVRKVQSQAIKVVIFHGHIINLSDLNNIERGVTFLISFYSH